MAQALNPSCISLYFLEDRLQSPTRTPATRSRCAAPVPAGRALRPGSAGRLTGSAGSRREHPGSRAVALRLEDGRRPRCMVDHVHHPRRLVAAVRRGDAAGGPLATDAASSRPPARPRRTPAWAAGSRRAQRRLLPAPPCPAPPRPAQGRPGPLGVLPRARSAKASRAPWRSPSPPPRIRAASSEAGMQVQRAPCQARIPGQVRAREGTKDLLHGDGVAPRAPQPADVPGVLHVVREAGKRKVRTLAGRPARKTRPPAPTTLDALYQVAWVQPLAKGQRRRGGSPQRHGRAPVPGAIGQDRLPLRRPPAPPPGPGRPPPAPRWNDPDKAPAGSRPQRQGLGHVKEAQQVHLSARRTGQSQAEQPRFYQSLHQVLGETAGAIHLASGRFEAGAQGLYRLQRFPYRPTHRGALSRRWSRTGTTRNAVRSGASSSTARSGIRSALQTAKACARPAPGRAPGRRRASGPRRRWPPSPAGRGRGARPRVPCQQALDGALEALRRLGARLPPWGGGRLGWSKKRRTTALNCPSSASQPLLPVSPRAGLRLHRHPVRRHRGQRLLHLRLRPGVVPGGVIEEGQRRQAPRVPSPPFRQPPGGRAADRPASGRGAQEQAVRLGDQGVPPRRPRHPRRHPRAHPGPLRPRSTPDGRWCEGACGRGLRPCQLERDPQGAGPRSSWRLLY